jgi:hypothetical protein
MNAEAAKRRRKLVYILLFFCVVALFIMILPRVFGSDMLPEGFKFPNKNWKDATGGVAFGGGNGNTEETAYEISSPAQLALLAKEVSEGNTFEGKFIALTADADLGGRLWNTIGTNENIFCGTLDGREFTIRNLSVNKSNSDDGGGFMCVNSGVVKNLSITDAVVKIDKANYGSISGFCDANEGIITNCFFSGTVIGLSDVGGFTIVNDGTIAYCGANVNVFSKGDIRPGIAGFASLNRGGIYNSYATGTVACGDSGQKCKVGGFVGESKGTYKQEGIFNCYAAVEVKAPTSQRSYPFVGYLDNSKTNVGYYDVSLPTNRSGSPFAEGSFVRLTGLSGDFMKSADFVDDLNTLDDSEAWIADTENINGGYPVLNPAAKFTLVNTA